jgi:hypothetical protein
MEVFRRKALKGGMVFKPWATPETFPHILETICRSEAGMKVRLQAPIVKVANYLSSRLKPNRSQLSVVKFGNGRLEEYRTPPAPAVVPSKIETPAVPVAAVAATTVAVPDKGCPVPEFAKAELRATRVLEAFLDPGQLEDFRRTNQFVTIGQDTGRRYLLTSRMKKDKAPKVISRTLFDLDLNQPVCVHDWEVPAAEELLGLHLFLSLPGWESWMLELPE